MVEGGRERKRERESVRDGGSAVEVAGKQRVLHQKLSLLLKSVQEFMRPIKIRHTF